MRIKMNGIVFRWSFKRFMINLVIVALIVTGFILYGTNATKANTNRKIVTLTVHKGDTLWSIAQTVSPQSDPRQMITVIKRTNNLANAEITAGQKLQINLN